MKEYKLRIADQILEDKLQAMGAVLIEGPKYCGKTTLAIQHAGSVLSMSDPNTKDQNLAWHKPISPDCSRERHLGLIDEWQLAPQFWDAIRNEVDQT